MTYNVGDRVRVVTWGDSYPGRVVKRKRGLFGPRYYVEYGRLRWANWFSPRKMYRPV